MFTHYDIEAGTHEIIQVPVEEYIKLKETVKQLEITVAGLVELTAPKKES